MPHSSALLVPWCQFRDPMTAWRTNITTNGSTAEVWMTAVGVQDDCLGSAALYISADFIT